MKMITCKEIIPEKYSIMNLDEFDQERHMLIDEATKLIQAQNDSNLPSEKFIRALAQNEIKIYKFKNKEYVDRLDIGRMYHQEPTQKKGLTIERYFTDGKSDPLQLNEEYVERRAEIKDNDGNIVFEMNGAIFPKSWNAVQVNIVTQKYFFKPDDSQYKEKLEAKLGKPFEHDIRQLYGRIVRYIGDEGEKQGYFATKEDKGTFIDELIRLMITRRIAFNSPVEFNAGIYNEYGVAGTPGMNYWRDPSTGEIFEVNEGSFLKAQNHACFINGPRDNLKSIGQHIMDEISIFSSGSGVGQNIGVLRSAGERLSGGGKSSGSQSFGKFFDATGGVIKSGGKSRRAARMMTTRYHHPDSMAFIKDKILEDYKIKILIENGFSGGMDGEAATTVAFQNSNLSVQLDDYFFQQVQNGGMIQLKAVKDGAIVGEVSADRMLKEISFGSWRIGDPGVQYESKIQEMHTVKNSGRINSSNPCSEYLSIDNTACNLVSLNVLEFSDNQGNIKTADLKHAAQVATIAATILNDSSSYPVKEIAQLSPELGNIGVGYAGVGSLLMRRGVPYNSDKGRAVVGSLTALLTGATYEYSTVMAENLGTFVQYEFNKKPMQEVMQKHKKNLDDIKWELVPDKELRDAAYNTWDNLLVRGEQYGFRNSQTTAIAPTGTIAYLLGVEDSTGIESLISLGINKNLAGGGQLEIKNKELPNALRNLGYEENKVQDILKYASENNMVEGAPWLNPEHYEVFETSLGNGEGIGTIPFGGHIRMIAAAQPFVSGAISKTCNVPETATVKDMYDNILLGYALGIKAIAMFRDNSKPTSVYFMKDKSYKKLGRGEKEDLPSQRNAQEIEFGISDQQTRAIVNYHMLVSEYFDGRPGQIAFLAFNQGSEMGAILALAGISVSKSLKRGVDLEDAISGWLGQKFEPNGMIVGHPYVKTAASILDFAAKTLLLEYKGMTEMANDPNSVDETKLRGFKNGAFDTYARMKIDEWNIEHVLADPQLGGFVKNKKKRASLSNGNGKHKASGAICKNGHIMVKTGPNCFKCSTCGDSAGGCTT